MVKNYLQEIFWSSGHPNPPIFQVISNAATVVLNELIQKNFKVGLKRAPLLCIGHSCRHNYGHCVGYKGCWVGHNGRCVGHDCPCVRHNCHYIVHICRCIGHKCRCNGNNGRRFGHNCFENKKKWPWDQNDSLGLSVTKGFPLKYTFVVYINIVQE